ncbi:MAG: type VII toxin-antitoxin system MntA family adenylyltransferase antitoxin [Desulfosudaceae bacterium]
MKTNSTMIAIIRRHFPDVQGIYLFGSHTQESARPDSDLDIALLLPHEQAKQLKSLAGGDCRFELENTLHQTIDLINARLVATVLQKEIICGDLVYCSDRRAVEEFEMLTLSYYQKLNQERAAILEEFYKTGRAFTV